jgi:hypothetical protein
MAIATSLRLFKKISFSMKMNENSEVTVTRTKDNVIEDIRVITPKALENIKTSATLDILDSVAVDISSSITSNLFSCNDGSFDFIPTTLKKIIYDLTINMFHPIVKPSSNEESNSKTLEDLNDQQIIHEEQQQEPILSMRVTLTVDPNDFKRNYEKKIPLIFRPCTDENDAHYSSDDSFNVNKINVNNSAEDLDSLMKICNCNSIKCSSFNTVTSSLATISNEATKRKNTHKNNNRNKRKIISGIHKTTTTTTTKSLKQQQQQQRVGVQVSNHKHKTVMPLSQTTLNMLNNYDFDNNNNNANNENNKNSIDSRKIIQSNALNVVDSIENNHVNNSDNISNINNDSVHNTEDFNDLPCEYVNEKINDCKMFVKSIVKYGLAPLVLQGITHSVSTACYHFTLKEFHIWFH